MSSFGLVALRSEDSQEDAQPIIDALGRLIINCGLLELYCKNGIFEFEQDENQQIKICNLKWGQRSDYLIKLIKKHVSENALQDNMNRVIQNTKDLMVHFRNSVAHGGVNVENDEIYIFDSKLRKNPENGNLETVREVIRLPELRQRVDESAGLVDEWVDLWERVQQKKPAN